MYTGSGQVQLYEVVVHGRSLRMLIQLQSILIRPHFLSGRSKPASVLGFRSKAWNFSCVMTFYDERKGKMGSVTWSTRIGLLIIIASLFLIGSTSYTQSSVRKYVKPKGAPEQQFVAKLHK